MSDHSSPPYFVDREDFFCVVIQYFVEQFLKEALSYDEICIAECHPIRESTDEQPFTFYSETKHRKC